MNVKPAMGSDAVTDRTQDCGAAWSSARGELRSQIGKDAFQNWIDPLSLIGAEKGVVRIAAPTSFIGAWVSRNYGESIRQLLAKGGLAVSRLEFSVAGAGAQAKAPEPARPAKPSAAPAEAAAGDDVELPQSPLDGRFTFDNFVVGKPNILAHAAARRVAEAQDVAFNPLFLYGGVGLGKTHLMHAIAWEVRNARPDARVLYISAEQFMYRFVSALRFKEMHGFKETFRSVDILMIDDVQFIAGKDSTQEEFFHTFNALIDQNKQIVISGDRAPGEIDGMEERIKSRLQWGLVVDLHPTDYELRLGILQAKAEAQQIQHPGVAIGAGGDGVPRAPDQLERAGSGRRADAALRVREPGRARDQSRHDPGMSRGHPARLRAQGHDRRDHPQGGGSLQSADLGSSVGAAGAFGGAAAAGGDVSVQDVDLAIAAQHRTALRRAGPHDGDPRRAQDRGAQADRQPDRRGCRAAAPDARGLIGPLVPRASACPFRTIR